MLRTRLSTSSKDLENWGNQRRERLNTINNYLRRTCNYRLLRAFREVGNDFQKFQTADYVAVYWMMNCMHSKTYQFFRNKLSKIIILNLVYIADSYVVIEVANFIYFLYRTWVPKAKCEHNLDFILKMLCFLNWNTIFSSFNAFI